MRIRIYISFCLLAILLASYGCGGSSEIEMKQARTAMSQAQKLHADTYAPADYQQAQKAWDHAQAAEKEGQTATAKVLFTSAKIYFGKAAVIALSKQEALTRELDAMQLMISKNFDEVKSDLLKNKLSPGQRSRVKAIVSEVEEGKAAIADLVIQGDLPKAVAAAKDVQTKIYHAQLILAGQKIK
jgi:hypothetical protein